MRRAHRIAVLEGGRLGELGDHATLLAAGGTYATMFQAQSERFRAADDGAAARDSVPSQGAGRPTRTTGGGA